MRDRSTIVQFGLVLVILFCIVIGIWLPFSFNISPVWDVWGTYQGIDTGQTPFIRVDVEAMRPFTNIPWYIAYTIDSTSFLGITIVLIAMLVAKGAAFYLVLRRLFPQLPPAFALAAAAIATAHPGDPHALYAGSIGGHLGIFLFFMSVYLLLVFVDNGRWPILVFALVCSLFSMGFSERTYPMVVLIPLLVIFKTGKLNRRAITAMGWWLGTAFPVFVLYGVSFFSESYKRLDRVAAGTFNPITLFERTIHAFQRVLVDGWILPSTNIPSSWLLAALLTGLVLIIILLYVQRVEHNATQAFPHHLLVLAIAGGCVMLAAGFAAFAPLEQYGTALRRALYLSVFGGALVLTSLLYLITLYLPAKRYLFSVLVGIVVVLGILNLQFMQRTEYQFALRQHFLLAAIIEAVPSPPQDSALFVTFNEDNTYQLSRFAVPGGLQNALSVVYGYHVNACALTPDISCELTTEGLQSEADSEEWQEPDPIYPYENLIGLHLVERGRAVVMSTEQVIELAPDSAVAEQIEQRYNPQPYFSARGELPPRYYTMLLPETTALRTFSKTVAPHGGMPFLSVEGEDLTVAAHLRYPQQNELETDGGHSWLWLGDGAQQGMTFYLHADSSVKVELALAVKPGPSRQDPHRTIEIRNTQTDSVITVTFDDQTTVTSDTLALEAGLNPIQITVMETSDTAAPNGDPRSLLVLLDSVQVKTLTEPSDD